ncbi:neuropeptide Y receptor type 6-like [Dreissena polymorpha]|uniref:G-protein coupled receptors family 1 profile domain-containing protein n=1 Tax=Dreissena polymorpha TaxID=45954 RepID=A0A9D4L899_DREPO|nr:neuropeptide Y receptor type 6-like [Dreissena polymorpha]KAH3853658.1 hypothetical protein DPMN_096190 [Dreissena polymorpha]
MEKTTTVNETVRTNSVATGMNYEFGNMSLEELDKQLQLQFFENISKQGTENLDLLQESHWKITIIVIYSIVIFIGFLENLVIVCILIRKNHLQNPTNIFILCLAVSDILLCLFNLPFQLHYQLTNQWVFGKTLCKVIMATYGVPVFVSSMSILMIAIDRYILIVHPFCKRMSTLTAVCLVTLIAICTTLVTVPIIIQMEYQVIDLPELNIYHTFCIELWQSVILRHIYTVSVLIVQFFLPLCVTTFLYIKISNVLRNRPIKKKEKRHKHKTNKILIAIVLCYAICWTPWSLFGLTLEFDPKIVPHVRLFDLLFKIFAMGSACINPFLYGWLNENFRHELNGIVKRGTKHRVRANGHSIPLVEFSRTEPGGDRSPAATV